MPDISLTSPIDLRPWRQFLALAEELHFGRAAARLHITQPPLTLAIQHLEAQLGTALFDRNRRRVALTPAGRALVEPVRRLLAQAQALPALARAAAAGLSGQLRLGFVSTIGYGALPGWLRSFREAQPEVQLTLREATLDVQLAGFESGDLDAGFVLHAPGAVPGGWGALAVAQEDLVLAVPDEHRCARQERVTPGEVLDDPVLIFPRAIGPSLYDAVLSFYSRRAVAPRIAQEAIQMQTIVNLVSAGMGVAWVPRSLMQLQRPGVSYLPCTEAPRCETSLLWPLEGNPVVQRFVAHVQACVGRPSGSATSSPLASGSPSSC